MRFIPLPPAEVLRQMFDYDPATGILSWKHRDRSAFVNDRAFRTFRSKFAGKPAGAVKRRKDGRPKSLVVRIADVLHPVHRVIWVWIHGDIPDELQVDHENRNPHDNRLCNLRLATHSQNQQNSRHKGNSTGLKCVVPVASGRFVAKLVHAGKQVHIGTFDTPEEANLAYAERAKQLYGEFAHP